VFQQFVLKLYRCHFTTYSGEYLGDGQCTTLSNAKRLKFHITPMDFFRQLIPTYEPLKRNILETELIAKIAIGVGELSVLCLC
jgi:hypothetical protein